MVILYALAYKFVI